MNPLKLILRTAAVLALAGSTAVLGQNAPAFLKGKVRLADDPGRSLEQRLSAAREAFRRTGSGEVFFAGYLFPAREEVRHEAGQGQGPFEVTAEAGRVKFKSASDSQSWKSEGSGAPAGVLWLNSLSGPGQEMLSPHLLDPKAVYDFAREPVYWLGSVDAETGLAFLEKKFEAAGEETRKSLLFVMAEHRTPRALDFLKTTALGSSSLEVRKTAVFWVGALKDSRSLGLLRQIWSGTQSSALREQVVFALSLLDDRGAVVEMVRIARADSDRSVRKNAIFWLGQKASREAVKALKDTVDSPAEDLEVKEAAVFAISQLPPDKAVPLLVSLARENKSPSVRKKALFWLGQTGGEEALKLFEEILLKKD
jgi:hypothetical protein